MMTLGKASSRTAPLPMMPLVAPFDELVRKAKVLQAGCEPEFARFVKNEDKNRERWLEAEQRRGGMEEEVKRLEERAATLETQLKHARLQAEYELQRRKAAEQEKYDANAQIGVIRDLLSDKSRSVIHETDRERLLSFTNSPRLSTAHHDASTTRLGTIMERSAHSFLDDVSFDKTEEDILSDSRLRSGKKWKRPSAPPAEMEVDRHTPPKVHRTRESETVVSATVTIDAGGRPNATLETSVPKLNKSFSEPSLDKRHDSDDDDDAFGFNRNNNYSSNRNINNNNNKPRKSILKSAETPTIGTPMLRKANSAGRGLNRIHIFVSKTVIKPEACNVCGKRIRFSKMAMKCKDCRAVCHPECKDKLPLPCIPSCPSTPGVGKAEGLISDYVSSERPMIPRLIVNCVNEIESRGLDEKGLYRVPGSDKDQKELKSLFLKGRAPNVSRVPDINVLCGTVKEFLRGLREPLLTLERWSRLVQAAETLAKYNKSDIQSPRECTETMCSLLQTLPPANLDTLAFLMRHLHRVASSPACQMPRGNLAKIFGPTVVGHSTGEPTPTQIMGETHAQARVMDRLFDVPCEFWDSVLDCEDTSLYPMGTPMTPDTAPRSMLGPLSTTDMPDSDASGVNTPRFAVKNREPSKPSRFFTSPLVL